jgi:hypothetical protein
MIDLREYNESIKAAVAAERKSDKNWGWNIKAVNKNEIKIGWGYLDYIGCKTPFTVTVETDDSVNDDILVVGTIPNGHKVIFLVGTKCYHDTDDVGEAVAKVIHGMAYSAHQTY